MSITSDHSPVEGSAVRGDRLGGLRLLAGLRRNAATAFPTRCFDEPAIRMRLIGRDVVLANLPEAIGQVLSTHPERYRRVPAIRRVIGPVVGRGVAASEGEVWRRQRRALAPAFTPRTVPVLSRHIAACTEAACARLDQCDGQPVDLLATMQRLSLDIATASMFSLESATFGGELRRLLTLYLDTIGRPRISDFLLPHGVPAPVDLRRALFRRRWTRLIGDIIAVRRAAAREQAPRDLFDLLSDAYRDEDEGLLLDEVSTMIVGAHENTSLTLFWACLLLAGAPEWQEAIRAEAITHDLSPEVAGAALPGLACTRAVVEETLRLYPQVFMIAREAAVAHELGGIRVTAGALVLLPFCMLYRNPRYWPAPGRFDPTRFLGGAERERFSYLPFGAGPNVCIGSRLAMAELVLVLARLLRDRTVDLVAGPPVLPVSQISTRPSRVPRFILRRRRT